MLGTPRDTTGHDGTTPLYDTPADPLRKKEGDSSDTERWDENDTPAEKPPLWVRIRKRVDYGK